MPKTHLDNTLTYFDLIPHSPTTLMHEPKLRYKHLCLFHFLLSNMIASLTHLFLEKDYNWFDPHVGDTLCQIRAAQLIQVAKNPQFNVTEYLSYLERYLQKVKLLIPTVEQLIKVKRSPELRRKQDKQTLESFLAESTLSLEIPEQVDYIVKTYLLTKYKIHPLGKNPKINYSALKSDSALSKDLSVRMVRHWQQSLASHSCDYISTLSTNTGSILPMLKMKDDDNRAVLPSFFVMQQILGFLSENNVKIILTIRNDQAPLTQPLVMIFQATLSGFQLIDSIDIEKPHFALHAVSNQLQYPEADTRKSLFQKVCLHGIKNILLASVANHPQYSGQGLSAFSDTIYQDCLAKVNEQSDAYQTLADINMQYQQFKEYAKSVGCDYNDPRFIFIEHMLIKAPCLSDAAFRFDHALDFEEELKQDTPVSDTIPTKVMQHDQEAIN